jgi:hypothetical protein
MKNILTRLMASAILAGICGMVPSLHAANSANALSKLLADARTHSSQLTLDWKSYTRQPNQAADATEIARMKEDVNATEKTITELNDSRGQASPSLVAAIEQIVPVLEEIADNTTESIEFLSSNQVRMTSKEYRQYVEDSSDTSSRLSDLISQLVDYANHKTKFDEAKRSLELAAN